MALALQEDGRSKQVVTARDISVRKVRHLDTSITVSPSSSNAGSRSATHRWRYRF